MKRSTVDAALGGKRILVTRAAGQARNLSDGLRAHGAEVVELPLIDFEAPLDPAPARRALEHPETYEYAVVTSANAASAVSHLDDSAWKRIASAGRPRVIAVGPATARALADRGVHVDIQPLKFSGEGVAEALDGVDLKGARVVLLRAENGHEFLPGWLREQGAKVDVVAVYRTVATSDVDAAVRNAVARGVDVVTFTSPSTVDAFRAALGSSGAPAGLRVACIGPSTATAVAHAGLHADIVASEASVEGLVSAICAYFST